MTPPLVSEYLKNHTLEQLRAEYGINFRLSSDLRKVSLNYDMIASPVGVKLVDECRGLILRPDIPFADEQDVTIRVFGSSTVVRFRELVSRANIERTRHWRIGRDGKNNQNVLRPGG